MAHPFENFNQPPQEITSSLPCSACEDFQGCWTKGGCQKGNSVVPSAEAPAKTPAKSTLCGDCSSAATCEIRGCQNPQVAEAAMPDALRDRAGYIGLLGTMPNGPFEGELERMLADFNDLAAEPTVAEQINGYRPADAYEYPYSPRYWQEQPPQLQAPCIVHEGSLFAGQLPVQES